jgi:ATP-dependent RNA helicase DeaD
MVFCQTKRAADQVASDLERRGFAVATVHGDLGQGQRERALRAFRSGKVDVLTAPEVAARGLDVDDVTHVVNYECPDDEKTYVHRIGRTGRAGRAGDALLFVTPRERHLLKAIEKATRQPITEMSLPTVDDVNARRVAKFADSITARLGASEVSLYRRLIEDYQREHDVPLADIAAAIAVIAQDGRSLLLEPEAPAVRRTPEKRTKSERDDRPDRAPRSGAPATARPPRGAPRRSDVPMAAYRLSVGRRQKVNPSQIVGALANEGGLRREDFGHIDIKVDHTLVELPAKLSKEVFAKLARTRISGQLIELRREPKPHRKG